MSSEETMSKANAVLHLIESVQAIVWRCDLQTYRMNFVSKEAEAILGYSTEEWTATADFLFDHMHPEDRDWAKSAFGKITPDKRNGQIDFRMIASDGRPVWIRSLVRLVLEGDEPKELIGIMIDLTEQKKIEQDVSQSREQLRALSRHLQNVREQERIKISREVHDDLGQVLSALKMELSLLNNKMLESSINVPRSELLEELGIMSNLVDDTISSVRRIISELRPEVLDHLDLTSAMEWQVHEFQKRTGIECSFRSNLRGKPFGEDGNTALFRILQETLTNVHRHANATHIRINLSQKDGRVILEVRDNGKGIEVKDINKNGSFGILGMKERAILLKGDMEITGNQGKGTTVRVTVPVA